MTRYWTSAVLAIRDEGPLRYGCHVFERGCGTLALCQAYGHTAEAAHAQAQRIIAALMAVEKQPAVAAAARHYIVRSPAHKNVAVHCGPQTTLELAYEDYFDACETANLIPKTFDQWKAGNHD